MNSRQLDQNAGFAAAEIPEVLNQISISLHFFSPDRWNRFTYSHKGNLFIQKGKNDPLQVEFPWSRFGSGHLSNVKIIQDDLLGDTSSFAVFLDNKKIYEIKYDENDENGMEKWSEARDLITLDKLEAWLLEGAEVVINFRGDIVAIYRLFDNLIYSYMIETFGPIGENNNISPLININQTLLEFYNNNISYYYQYLIRNSKIILSRLDQYFTPDLSQEILEYGVLETFTSPKTHFSEKFLDM